LLTEGLQGPIEAANFRFVIEEAPEQDMTILLDTMVLQG